MILAALLFFLPVAFISAELATGWPDTGGVFVWVKEAFGHRWGFLSIWYLWLLNIPWYPTALAFIAGALAFTFNPELANNKMYYVITILILLWCATLFNLRGMKVSGWISTVAVIAGTIIPGLLIIIMGWDWLMSKQPIEINISWDGFFPNLTKISQLTFLTGVIFSMGGIEMSAVHAKEVINPKKTYPRAILLSVLIIFVISSLGTLSIASVIPQKEISLTSGAIDSLAHFFAFYGMEKLLPVIAVLIAIGAFGQLSTWMAGPSKGLMAAAKYEELPSFLCRTNKNRMPLGLMITQAIIVSFLSLIFLLMPTVSSSFWLFTALTSQYYLLMYILMFLAAITLKFKKPDVPRSYQVPGGKVGICFLSVIGILTCLFTFFMGFVPPAQIKVGNLFFYESFLILGIVIGSLIPSILLYYKKKS